MKGKLIRVSVGLFICMALLLTACGSTASVSTTQKNGPAEETPVREVSEKAIYGLGDLITVSKDGAESYMISIDRVITTEERNEFADSNPAQVVTISYTYWNVGSKEDICLTEMDFKVLDSGSNVCSSYPLSLEEYAACTPMGAKCKARMSFGLETPSDNIRVHFYDNMWNSESDFILELPTNGSSDNTHDDVTVFAAPADPLAVGETMIISTDGMEKYSITINSARKTDERNPFAGSRAASVWLIDYTFENLGSDQDIYVSEMDFNVVDETGNVCRTYPGSTNKYPNNTPIGAKCSAQMCFGTQTDTNILYLYFYDNMWNNVSDAVIKVSAQ